MARLFGTEIADAVDPLKRGEPGAPRERPTSGPDRYAVRHVGTDASGDRLTIFFSCVGHRPKRILCTVVDLFGPPETRRARGVIEVLWPEKEWEGPRCRLPVRKAGDLAPWKTACVNRRCYVTVTTPGSFTPPPREHGLVLARLRYNTTGL